MSDSQLNMFFYGAAGVCAVMVAFTLTKIRTRGISAVFLSIGFIAFGFLLFGLAQKWGQIWLIACGAILGVCLIADFVSRSAKEHGKK